MALIWEERNPDWWRSVAEHPAVAPHVGLGRPMDFTAVTSEAVKPLRSENGGFLFVRLDAIGRVFELHTLYRPEGWGREVFSALRGACESLFRTGAQLITTFEVEGYAKSRPPRTFRFEPGGDFAPTPGFSINTRTWVLRKEAWDTSPARRGM